MTGSTVETLIWIVSEALMAVVLVAMVRRRLFGRFPVFGSFILYELVSGFIVHWCHVRMYSGHYWFVYWPNQLIEGIVTWFVLQELFRNVLRPYASFRS